jgi:hypothetical protein
MLNISYKGASMETKKQGPKKGSIRKWIQMLKDIGESRPPDKLIDSINKKDKEDKKVARANKATTQPSD